MAKLLSQCINRDRQLSNNFNSDILPSRLFPVITLPQGDGPAQYPRAPLFFLSGLCELLQIHVCSSGTAHVLTLSNQSEIDNRVSQSGSALLKIQPIVELGGGHVYKLGRLDREDSKFQRLCTLFTGTCTQTSKGA